MTDDRAITAAAALGLSYHLTRHGPVRSLEEAAAARGLAPAQVVKTIVVRVTDGEAALAAADRERPDVIILDVMMPLLDGFSVLGRLKADPDLRAIPVIMLTARGQERDVLAGLQGGAADYVVKPFSLKELLARVDVALRRG